MKFKTIIKENEATVNNHIYRQGCLQKFKDRLQPNIDNKTCFVMFHETFATIYKENIGISEKSNYSWIYNDKFLGDSKYCGVVNSFDIEEGQGILDIDLLDVPGTELVKVAGVDMFKIDFPLCGRIEEPQAGQSLNSPRYFKDEDDWDLPPVVLLTRNV